MSFQSELRAFVQPSILHAPGSVAAGQWVRGIPVPGAPMAVNPLPPVGGVPTCANLLGDAAPAPGQVYGIYSYTIGFAVFAQPDLSTSSGGFAAEMALLVGGQPRYITSVTLPALTEPGAVGCYCSGSWVSDLTNPLLVAASSSLALRIGAQPSQAVTYLDMYVGIMQQPAGSSLGPLEFDSTLTYSLSYIA